MIKQLSNEYVRNIKVKVDIHCWHICNWAYNIVQSIDVDYKQIELNGYWKTWDVRKVVHDKSDIRREKISKGKRRKEGGRKMKRNKEGGREENKKEEMRWREEEGREKNWS